MFRSIKLGTAFGIGIYMHWSFPFLLVLVAFLARAAGMAAAVYAVALVLAMFACVVLHELGHALMARRFGIGTRDITLLPIGGVARLEKIIDRPWEEFWIAVAGPAVNLVIAAGLLGILLLAGVDLSLKALFQSATIGASQELVSLERFSFIERLGMGLLITNIFLMTFNMIPAFPMDGGRVLRALLSTQLGQLPATEIAAVLGTVFAALFGLLGILAMIEVQNPLIIVLALFLYVAGQQELAVVRYRASARRPEEILDVLPADQDYIDLAVPPPDPHFSGFTWDRSHHVWIEWRNGRPVHACAVDMD
jgi:Zn-dependent protease